MGLILCCAYGAKSNDIGNFSHVGATYVIVTCVVYVFTLLSSKPMGRNGKQHHPARTNQGNTSRQCSLASKLLMVMQRNASLIETGVLVYTGERLWTAGGDVIVIPGILGWVLLRQQAKTFTGWPLVRIQARSLALYMLLTLPALTEATLGIDPLATVGLAGHTLIAAVSVGIEVTKLWSRSREGKRMAVEDLRKNQLEALVCVEAGVRQDHLQVFVHEFAAKDGKGEGAGSVVLANALLNLGSVELVNKAAVHLLVNIENVAARAKYASWGFQEIRRVGPRGIQRWMVQDEVMEPAYLPKVTMQVAMMGVGETILGELRNSWAWRSRERFSVHHVSDPNANLLFQESLDWAETTQLIDSVHDTVRGASKGGDGRRWSEVWPTKKSEAIQLTSVRRRALSSDTQRQASITQTAEQLSDQQAAAVTQQLPDDGQAAPMAISSIQPDPNEEQPTAGYNTADDSPLPSTGAHVPPAALMLTQSDLVVDVLDELEGTIGDEVRNSLQLVMGSQDLGKNNLRLTSHHARKVSKLRQLEVKVIQDEVDGVCVIGATATRWGPNASFIKSRCGKMMTAMVKGQEYFWEVGEVIWLINEGRRTRQRTRFPIQLRAATFPPDSEDATVLTTDKDGTPTVSPICIDLTEVQPARTSADPHMDAEGASGIQQQQPVAATSGSSQQQPVAANSSLQQPVASSSNQQQTAVVSSGLQQPGADSSSQQQPATATSCG